MREIKYRGYSKENEQWCYGYFFIIPYKHLGTKEIKHLILKKQSDYVEDIDVSQCIIVDADSIGQFTGYIDKNKKEIYEGDIVEYEKYDEIDTYINRAEVYFDTELGAWMAHEEEVSSDIRLSSMDGKVEVIGNIYEDKLKRGK